jgi:hypothetical protein
MAVHGVAKAPSQGRDFRYRARTDRGWPGHCHRAWHVATALRAVPAVLRTRQSRLVPDGPRRGLGSERSEPDELQCPVDADSQPRVLVEEKE